jgi:DNA primase
MIPDSFKQDLLNRVDILDVVSRHVQLKKAGANHVGLCPFHGEKTPSFTVSPAKQFYHCFGCGAHGNAIGFVMAYGALGYVEAVNELAASLGMQVPDSRPRTAQEMARKERETDLYAIMEKALEFYRAELKRSASAIDYLKRRGLTGEIAARFRLGYAPGGWQALKAAFPAYDDASLLECGLVIESEEGRRYDRFRDRVMFPILNARGAVIGFGGRVLGEGDPKYLNSPETALFEKGRELYGLSQAREAIGAAGRVLVVEGYMDVVALAQFGLGYAVATLGTATTPVHISKLLRLADEIVFAFDGDAAGRKAAWRALEVALPLALDHKPVRFLFLPEGEDPDSLIRRAGPQALEKRLRAAQTLSGFLVAELRSRVELATAEGRSRLLAEAKPHVQSIAAPALRLQVLKEVAALAGVSQDEAERLLGVPRVRRYARLAPAASRAPATTNLESRLLRYLLLRPERADTLDLSLIDAGLPESAALGAFVDWCKARAPAKRLEHALLIEHFGSTPHASALFAAQQSLLELKLSEEEAEAEIENCLHGLRVKRTRDALETLRRQVERGEAGREELAQYARMLREFEELKRVRRLQGSALL